MTYGVHFSFKMTAFISKIIIRIVCIAVSQSLYINNAFPNVIVLECIVKKERRVPFNR